MATTTTTAPAGYSLSDDDHGYLLEVYRDDPDLMWATLVGSIEMLATGPRPFVARVEGQPRLTDQFATAQAALVYIVTRDRMGR